MVCRDHHLAALEAGDLAQNLLQLLKGLLHRLAGLRLGIALVTDLVDAVVIDHDQVVIAAEFGPLASGGEVEERFRLDRLGPAVCIGLEDFVAVGCTRGALAIHQGGAIGGIEAVLRTGQQGRHAQLGVSGQGPEHGLHLRLPAFAGLAVEAISEVAGGLVAQGIGDHHKQALEPPGTER